MAKYFRRGKSKIKWVPTIADKSAPTRIELNAGTDLSPSIAEVNGFQYSNSRIATPNLADSYTPQIDGEDTTPDSGFTFYDDDASSAVRTALAKGTLGYVCFFPYGDVATKRMEVWPAKSTGVNDEWTVGNEAARFAVGFAIHEVPDQDVTIPT